MSTQTESTELADLRSKTSGFCFEHSAAGKVCPVCEALNLANILSDTERKLATARAALETARNQMDAQSRIHEGQLAASRADVTRLLEALKRIIVIVPTPTTTLSWEQEVDRIAREALAATPSAEP